MVYALFRWSGACLRSIRRNHYHTLDIKFNAEKKEIKEAYLILAKKLHPDANSNDPEAHEKFQKLQEAYATLAGTKSRQKYDSENAEVLQYQVENSDLKNYKFENTWDASFRGSQRHQGTAAGLDEHNHFSSDPWKEVHKTEETFFKMGMEWPKGTHFLDEYGMKGKISPTVKKKTKKSSTFSELYQERVTLRKIKEKKKRKKS